MQPKFKWEFAVAGGIGENLWDDSFVVEAEDFSTAAKIAIDVLTKGYSEGDICAMELVDDNVQETATGILKEAAINEARWSELEALRPDEES